MKKMLIARMRQTLVELLVTIVTLAVCGGLLVAGISSLKAVAGSDVHGGGAAIALVAIFLVMFVCWYFAIRYIVEPVEKRILGSNTCASCA